MTLAVAGLAVVAQPGPSAPTDPDPIAAVRAHLASAPQDAAAWARLGALELRQAAETHDPRHYPDADAALTRSLLLRPDGNTAALAGLAALRTAQHRFGESVDLARRALALDPQDPAVWGTLADAADGLGHDDDAHDAVAHMLDLRPDTAGRIRSASLDELSGRVDVARATLDQAVAGAKAATQDAYGWALMANGRGAEALTWADKATSTGVRSALFTFHKGMIESSLDRADAARADLATALRIDPWFSPRLAPLARVTLTALSGPQ